MAESANASLGGGLPPQLRQLSPLSQESLTYETVYHPVVAYYRTRRTYAVPAIRVMPGKDGAPTSLFPLSQAEIGEVWTSEEELEHWDVQVVEGGWTRAEICFRPMVRYPHSLLKTLLTVFQTQRFSSGPSLSWTSWPEACRRPSELIQVVSECSACSIARAFAPRVLWTAPKEIPDWTCGDLGVACGERQPEVITETSRDLWVGAKSRVSKSSISRFSQPAPTLPPISPKEVRPPALLDLLQEGGGGGAVPPVPLSKEIYVSPKDVLGDVIAPEDSISNLGVKREGVLGFDTVPARGVTGLRHGWEQRERGAPDPLRTQELSRHIIGQPLLNFTEPDPDPATITQFEQLVEGPRGNHLRRDFIKWAESRREAMFEGRNDVGNFIEWRETLEYYFSTAPIGNPALQFWMATLTFRKAAMRWWGARAKQYPRLVLTFAQLVEWLRTELVPCANPEEAMAAWQQLAYRGDVEDYLKQYDKLTLCYPLSHALTLAQATQPLGSEVKAGAQRVDMQYGREGMSHRQLRQYLEFYLRELKPHESRTLAEKSVMRGGFGAMPSHKGRTQLRQARDVNTTLTDGEEVFTELSHGKATLMPKPLQSAVWGEQSKDGSLGQRRPKKIGKGPRPCWVCGSDRHNMFLCPRQLKTSAKCKVCGSDAHLTKECHQRYFPQVEVPTRSEGHTRPREAEERVLASTRRTQRKAKQGETEPSKEPVKEGTSPDSRPMLASACLMAKPQGPVLEH